MSEQKLVEPSPSRPPLPKQPEVNIGTSGHVDSGKCLAWDEYALMGGRLATGAEIEAKVRAEGKLVSRVDGGELFELDSNDVVSLGRDFEPVRARSYFYKQDYRGKILTVKGETGRALRVTPEHPLLTNKEGNVTWTRAKDLRVGDSIGFLSRVPLAESVSFPNPDKAMRQKYQIVAWDEYRRLHELTVGFANYSALGVSDFDRLRMLCGLSTSNLARLAHIDLKTWRRLISGSRELSPEHRAKLKNALSGISIAPLSPGEFIATSRGLGMRTIRRMKNFELDEDLAKWFAFVWSEGSSSSSFVGVTQQVQMRMLAEYLEITRRKLGQEYQSYGGKEYRIHCSAFVDYLRFKFAFSPGNKESAPISPWVCQMPARLKAVFLRWFLTLDGEVHSGEVSISQANDRNIAMISYLLLSFGIVSRFDRVWRRVKSGRKAYSRLRVSGRRNLDIFARDIGFEDEEKQAKLLSYLRSIKRASKETDLSIEIDRGSLRALFLDLGLIREGFSKTEGVPLVKESDWHKAYEAAARTGRMSRSKLLRLLESIEDHMVSIDNSLSRLPSNPRVIESHLSLLGVSQNEAAMELGMSRKKLVRVIRRGKASEVTKVLGYVQKKTLETVSHSRRRVEQLRLLASSPLEFDRIVSIEEQPYEGKIYDLSVPGYQNFVAGKGAIVAHNTTLTQAITGIWASAHSEELKRGITIKVGYADAAFYRCSRDQGPGSYSTSSVCPVDGTATTLLRAVSFVDAPGHESLMTNMLAGAFVMDGAVLVIAANEPVPRPQTREHLQALQMLGMKKIVIAQNKVDLVTDQEAQKNYELIQKFVKGTVAADAPIIPISAQQKLNIDALIQAIEEVIPTPERDAKADPLMYVVRSFDVNRPGAEVKGLAGGVLGGSLTRGELTVGEEIELKPGMVDERSGKFVPIITKVTSLQTGAGPTDKVGPGGLVAAGTHLDPTFIKGDQMVGSVIGKPGSLPETLEHITLDVSLLETAVGSADLAKVDRVRLAETFRLNLGTASTLATTTSVRGDVVELDLKKPVAIETGMRAAISRRIADRWRLIGSGVLK